MCKAIQALHIFLLHYLFPAKKRKHFTVHKCVNKNCSYYLQNLKKVKKEDLNEPFGKNKYKLHYIYREFNIDFFKMDIDSLPSNASSLNFKNKVLILWDYVLPIMSISVCL